MTAVLGTPSLHYNPALVPRWPGGGISQDHSPACAQSSCLMKMAVVKLGSCAPSPQLLLLQLFLPRQPRGSMPQDSLIHASSRSSHLSRWPQCSMPWEPQDCTRLSSSWPAKAARCIQYSRGWAYARLPLQDQEMWVFHLPQFIEANLDSQTK